MLLSTVSVLVVAHSSSEIPEGLMNNPVFYLSKDVRNCGYISKQKGVLEQNVLGNTALTE